MVKDVCEASDSSVKITPPNLLDDSRAPLGPASRSTKLLMPVLRLLSSAPVVGLTSTIRPSHAARYILPLPVTATDRTSRSETAVARLTLRTRDSVLGS